ncbi:MAG: putative sulfate exporter family transporter [Pseudomonadota bacterium]
MFDAGKHAGLVARGRENLRALAPGILVSAVIGIAAQFMSEHYGAPAMLMALLLGIAFHFLAEEGRCVQGIEFTAKAVLRLGVALLGVRISAELIMGLGIELIALVVTGVALTIGVAMLAGRLFGHDWRLALLTGGSVAICGASAAMAIAAVLPKDQHSERNLIFTVLGVTVLSTIAMILYPIVVQTFALDDRAVGVFLGGTIHDVAQVVGAGFSVSDIAGDSATLVKLIRVSLLAPVVLFISLAMRSSGAAAGDSGTRPPLVPGFVIAFIVLASLNSAGAIPADLGQTMSDVSRWALLFAIAAVGMKVSLKRIMEVGGPAVALIVGETLFLAVLILGGILLLA